MQKSSCSTGCRYPSRAHGWISPTCT
jgi:hypothetical protein